MGTSSLRRGEILKEPMEGDRYPTMRNMVGAHFNQDWDIISGSDDPDVLLGQINKKSSPAYLENLIRELKEFLATYGQSDDELTDAFERVFTPEADFYDVDRMTSREGFCHAIEVLSRPRQVEQAATEQQKQIS